MGFLALIFLFGTVCLTGVVLEHTGVKWWQLCASIVALIAATVYIWIPLLEHVA
jgi:Ca2+/Na+ antiporter